MTHFIEIAPAILMAFANIGSLITSAFAAPGENAAQGQAQSRQQVSNQLTSAYGQLVPQSLGLAKTSLSYAQQMQPYYEAALNQGIAQNTQQGALANAEEEGNYANSVGANQARQAGLALGAQGAGEGAIGGATAGAFGQAAQTANAAYAQALSPQMRSQALQQRLGLLAGTQSPSFGPLQQAGQGEESASFGAPTDQVGQNPLGSLIGSALPAGINAIPK